MTCPCLDLDTDYMGNDLTNAAGVRGQAGMQVLHLRGHPLSGLVRPGGVVPPQGRGRPQEGHDAVPSTPGPRSALTSPSNYGGRTAVLLYVHSMCEQYTVLMY